MIRTDIVSIFTKTKGPLTIHTAAALLCVITQSLLLAVSAGYNEECLRCQKAIYHIQSTDKETIVICQEMGEKKRFKFRMSTIILLI